MKPVVQREGEGAVLDVMGCLSIHVNLPRWMIAFPGEEHVAVSTQLPHAFKTLPGEVRFGQQLISKPVI